MAGTLMGFMIFVLPRYDAIKEARNTIETKEIEVAAKKKFVEKMAELKKQIDARQDDLAKVESLISTGKHTQDVIINLESISQEAGVALNDFKIGVSKGGGDNYEVLQIEFSTSGQYAVLSNLIKLMEKNLRIMDIQELSFTKKETEGLLASPLLLLSLKLNTYYLK